MNNLETTSAWYLIDYYNTKKRQFLTNSQNSRFIFIGKSSDCDVKLVSIIVVIIVYFFF